eukprot:TRINITY_DN9373_c0_g1_i8.p1 TRINITY_DN9373_c0_g1~~TRINITY_DN9373_c0_g1_i8.p1  ORF type:complete len:598 (+),score=143.22 TRINITY_DN9373_c0_g1_i8:50-1843(+)
MRSQNNYVNQYGVSREINGYELGQMLGKGCFGHVRIARRKEESLFKYAMKYMKMDNTRTKKHLDYLLEQESVLKDLDHENVLKVYEINGEGSYRKQKQSGTECIRVAYIVLQLAPNGDLFDFIVGTGGLTEDMARWYFAKILSAVHYLHSHGIAHRDIKLENILLDENYNPLVCDFGLSKKLADVGFTTKKHIDRVGTEYCMSPELLANEEHSPIKDDIFALGYLLFMMVAKHQPFQKSSSSNPYYKLIRMNGILQYWRIVDALHAPKWCSNKFKHLITSMLNCEMAVRPSLAEVKRHQWMLTKHCYIASKLTYECSEIVTNILRNQRMEAKERRILRKEKMKKKEKQHFESLMRKGNTMCINIEVDKIKKSKRQVMPRMTNQLEEANNEEKKLCKLNKKQTAKVEQEKSYLPSAHNKEVLRQKTAQYIKTSKNSLKKANRTRVYENLHETNFDSLYSKRIDKTPPQKSESSSFLPTKSAIHKPVAIPFIDEGEEDNKPFNLSMDAKIVPTGDAILTDSKISIRPKLTMIMSQESIDTIESSLAEFLDPKQNAKIELKVDQERKILQASILEVLKNTNKHKVNFIIRLVHCKVWESI